MPSKFSKILVAFVWIAALGSFLWWSKSQGYSVLDSVRLAHSFAVEHPAAPLVLLALFVARPLILFPVSPLVVLSGSLLGFGWGFALVMAGTMMSASLAYAIARFLTGDQLDHVKALDRWRPVIEEQGFTGTLITRLLYVPFDIVNYGCGALGVPFKAFFLASLLGLPSSLIAITSFGASIDIAAFLSGDVNLSLGDLLDAKQLVITAALVVGSIILAIRVKQRHEAKQATGRQSE